MRRLSAFVRKEFLQTLRDFRTRFIVFAAPLIQLVIFGYVATLDVKSLRVTWIPWENSPETRRLITALQSGGIFRLTRVVYTPRQMDHLLRAGKTDLGVWTTPWGTLVVVDGTQAQMAQIGLAYLQGYLKGDGPTPELLRVRVLYNPELRSAPFMLPGVAALIIILSVAILTAVALTREKEQGTYEMLLMTPLTRGQIILGKILPYGALGLFNSFTVVLLAHLVFQMPVRGDLLWVALGIILYVWSFAALSVWISSFSETQQQAMLTTFLFILPMLLLSGLFFPIESMPLFFQKLAWLNPLTHILILLRGIFLTGASGALYPESYAVLGAFGGVTTFLAIRSVREVLA